MLVIKIGKGDEASEISNSNTNVEMKKKNF